MTYRVQIQSRALKELSKIPKRDQQRLRQRIRSLVADPRPLGVKKIRGEENLYRLRQGDWRILYEIEDDVLLVLVVRVGHRRDIYR